MKALIPATLALLVAIPTAQAGDTLIAADAQAPQLRATLAAELDAEPRDAAATVDPAVLDKLDLDAASLAPPSRTWQLPPLDSNTSQWKRSDTADGTALITVQQPLPLTWDTKVGADLRPAAATPIYDPAKRPLPVVGDRGAGAAWINLAVPNLAAVEVRANSDQDQNQFGARFIRSLPLGEKYAVTLENRYAVIEPLGGAPAAVPTAIAPGRALSTDRLVKFDIRSSGTTLAVATTNSTADNITHNKLLAEQNIVGPLSITTALTDLGTPAAAKSISAGFKLNW